MTTAEQDRHRRGAFAALTSRNYRIYLCGQSLANTGTWVQSIAQDWLVFDLTHSSTAVGVTMALQFLPIMALGLHTGLIADRVSKRRILLITQTLNAVATATLAAITIAGAVRATDVYAFALLSGLIYAFDAPPRQAFVAEDAPPDQLRAAIALNGAVFQATRLIGPAIASLLIANVGTGWAFAANAACYIGPTIGLLRLRQSELVPAPVVRREPGALRTSARYLRRHPDVLWTIALVAGAGAGARPKTSMIVVAAAGFGLLQTAAAFAPDMALFLTLLCGMGFGNLVFQAMANSSVQLSIDPELRGRVMGLYMLVFIGGTPIGAPIIGAITNHYGARVGLAVCGIIPVLAVAVRVAVMAGTRSDDGGSAAHRFTARVRAVSSN